MRQFVADDGEIIHYVTTGEGPPIVLLHGWTSSHLDWTPFLDAFAARHRVLCPDARGHGGHALKTATAPNLARMAEDLHQLLAVGDLTHATLVGHSMGALTVWQYLRDFGAERVAHAVIIDQSPRLVTDADWPHGIYGDFDAERNTNFIAALEHDFAEAVLRLVAEGMNAEAARRYLRNGKGIQSVRRQLRSLAPKPLIDCWRSLTDADLRDSLAAIPIPVLLVYGEHSEFYTLEAARTVHARIPDATLRIYEGTDHSPHLWQRERFAGDVLTFLGT